MNRRPMGSLSLAKAITGFLQYKAAEGLIPNAWQADTQALIDISAVRHLCIQLTTKRECATKAVARRV